MRTAARTSGGRVRCAAACLSWRVRSDRTQERLDARALRLVSDLERRLALPDALGVRAVTHDAGCADDVVCARGVVERRNEALREVRLRSGLEERFGRRVVAITERDVERVLAE